MPKGNVFYELGIQPSLNAFSFFIQKFYIYELERKLCFQIVEMRSRYHDSQQGAFFAKRKYYVRNR